MARPTLMGSWKFKMLVAILRCPPAHARGYLELLWDTAYESGDAYLGPDVLVEYIAGWPGEPGALVRALVECGRGGVSGHGFIEPHPSGGYQVHDLWDHSPDYVRRRFRREQQRKETGERYRSDDARVVSDRSVAGHRPVSDQSVAAPPAPAPSPSSLHGISHSTYILPPSPPPNHARGREHAHEKQVPRQEDGGSAPGPPDADVSGAPDLEGVRRAAGDLEAATSDRQQRKRGEPRKAKPNGAVDPKAAPIPGEDLLPELARRMFYAHPEGNRGGRLDEFERGLLDLLRRGRIWPDDHPPDPMPPKDFGLSFSAFEARHLAWCEVWPPHGDRAAMNLVRTYCGDGHNGRGGMRFLEPPPARASPRNRGQPWNPGSDAATLERLEKELLR